MYKNEDNLTRLSCFIDRLQAEQHLEMLRLVAKHPQEGTAAYKKCVARQGVQGGGLTLSITEQYTTEAMNLFAQSVRGGARDQEARCRFRR